MATQDVSSKVISRIYGWGRGRVFSRTDLADLGSASSIRQALARHEKLGTIRRLARGYYEFPRYSKLFQGPVSADPHSVAQALARSRGWTIVPTGQTALNVLGLSTQVPASWAYLSDGPTKTFAWSGGTIVFKKRTNRETSILSFATALLVQGVKALGQEHVTPQVLETLSKRFDKQDWGKALREAKYSTDWVYSALKKAAAMSGPRL